MGKKLGGLGKGLNAIFIENDSETEGGTVTHKISEIEPNRTQPRKEFDEQALSELAESISQHGLLQPLLVRPSYIVSRTPSISIDSLYCLFILLTVLTICIFFRQA